MIVLDINVDDVNGLTSGDARVVGVGVTPTAGSECKVVEDLVVDPLFSCQDEVVLSLSGLEALWAMFDPAVAVKHVQDPVLCVH